MKFLETFSLKSPKKILKNDRKHFRTNCLWNSWTNCWTLEKNCGGGLKEFLKEFLLESPEFVKYLAEKSFLRRIPERTPKYFLRASSSRKLVKELLEQLDQFLNKLAEYIPEVFPKKSTEEFLKELLDVWEISDQIFQKNLKELLEEATKNAWRDP